MQVVLSLGEITKSPCPLQASLIDLVVRIKRGTQRGYDLRLPGLVTMSGHDESLHLCLRKMARSITFVLVGPVII